MGCSRQLSVKRPKDTRGFGIYADAPNLLSATKSGCLPLAFSTISFDKNFFRPLPILPSWTAVISATAVAVVVNRCRAQSFNLHVPKQKSNFRTGTQQMKGPRACGGGSTYSLFAFSGDSNSSHRSALSSFVVSVNLNRQKPIAVS